MIWHPAKQVYCALAFEPYGKISYQGILVLVVKKF